MNKWDKFKKGYLHNWQLYLLLLIPVIFVIIFSYIPLFGVQIAFKKFDIVKGIWGSPWVGMKNFMRFFKAPNFWFLLRNTVSLSVYSLLAGFPIPIMLALVLNSFPGIRYKKFVQTVSYMPHFISTVVIVGMLMQIFNPRTGTLGNIYSGLTGNYIQDLFAKPSAFPHLYVWSGIWQSMGWSSIVYLAALSGVDPGLHEAAQVEGANRLQRVWHIDLPTILPTATILLIMSAGSIMSIGFEKVYLMQNSLNISRSEVISTYVYKVGLTIGSGDFSFATAIGLFNSVINFTILVIVNYITKKLNSTSLW